MVMKRKFEEVKIEIVEFECKDVITASALNAEIGENLNEEIWWFKVT